MSGILRNTLRIVGTAKYAPNNSTKYLRSMTLTTNHLNNSLAFQANQISTHFETTIQAARKKILSLLPEKVIKAKIDHLKVSLGSGKIRLITEERAEDLIFPPTFRVELNEKSFESDEERDTLLFKLGKWKVSLDDDELTFTIKDTGETFILKHAVHIKAHIGPLKPLENGGFRLISGPASISDVIVYPAKVISESAEGLVPLDREYLPVNTMASAEQLKSYGNRDVVESRRYFQNVETIDDKPNDFGRMKLKFPMTASLEGFPLKIEMKDTDDTYTAYHTVDIRASKNLTENLKKESTDGRRSKIGILRMELESGDLIFEPRNSSDQRVFMRQEVDIEIDLDSEIPSILINPHIKSYHDL